MRHIVVDLSKYASDRSLASEERLKRRIEDTYKEAVDALFKQRAVSDLTSQGSVTVRIRLDEPGMRFDHETGSPSFIIPGNPKFWVGDRIEKPEEGGGMGAGAGGGDAEDEYVFEAPVDELERRMFEDLALPDMAQKQLMRVCEETIERAGLRTEGPPAALDLVRSSTRAIGRRRAFGRPKLSELREAEEQLAELKRQEPTEQIALAIAELERSIAKMRARRKITPFMDKGDLRFRRSQNVELPISQAVIFNLMDVSGSMTEHHKELAKRFFWLLRRLISLEYKEIDIVWIKHTDTAQEVTEKDFFFSRSTGGTVVSSALEKMLEIVKARYPLHLWNVYACQATDGDVWRNIKGEDDAITSTVILETMILPIVQYYAYIECWDRPPANKKKQESDDTRLWAAYRELTGNPKFQMERVHAPEEIFKVFEKLFRDKGQKKRRVAA